LPICAARGMEAHPPDCRLPHALIPLRVHPCVTVVAKVERAARVPGHRRPLLLSKQVHETATNITLALVVLHLCGVAFASLLTRKILSELWLLDGKKAETTAKAEVHVRPWKLASCLLLMRRQH
jgi:cytochrome b